MNNTDFGQLGKHATLYQSLLTKIPITYMGIMKRLVGKEFQTILDVGCGTGTPMELIKQDHPECIATGVDIYKPYIDEARKKGIYKEIIESNVTELPFNDKSFDVVVCFHVIEHLEKEEGVNLLNKLETIARKRVIVAMPVGELPQDEYDGNKYQEHRSVWMPEDLKKRGYTVIGQGLKAIYGTENIVMKYGIFSNAIFAIAMLFQPLLFIKPERGVYMLAKKELAK